MITYQFPGDANFRATSGYAEIIVTNGILQLDSKPDMLTAGLIKAMGGQLVVEEKPKPKQKAKPVKWEVK